jgi:hypothetical protein
MKKIIKDQIVPIGVSLVTLIILSFAYFGEINFLNSMSFVKEKIDTYIHWPDVGIGMLIYLKTSIDFALLIGILMKKFDDVKGRIIIEVGTSLGNVVGTMVVLAIWVIFRTVPWLLAGMIILASLVLLKLAATSLEHIGEKFEGEKVEQVDKRIIKVKKYIESFLNPVNKFLSPVVSRITPDLSFNHEKKMNGTSLLFTAFTIPFVLGLDDFAGYVPNFRLFNVFGFGLGVFLGHSLLLILLFTNPIIGILGSIAFIGLALYGGYEAIHALIEAYLH